MVGSCWRAVSALLLLTILACGGIVEDAEAADGAADDSEELQVHKAESDPKKDEDKLTAGLDAAEAALSACCDPSASRPGPLRVVNNNLGGAGPAPNGPAWDIRYRGIAAGCATDDQKSVDLVVTATTQYASSGSASNGLHGQLMQINLVPTAVKGADVDIVLGFESKSGTGMKQVHAKEMLLYVFDLDQDANGQSQAAVMATGYEDFYLSPQTTLVKTLDLTKGHHWFVSSVAGNASDEQTDLQSLTPEEQNKMIAFRYTDVSQIKVSFQVTKGTKDHNFLFAVKMCTSCGVVPRTTSPSPSAAPSPASGPGLWWKAVDRRACSGSEVEWNNCPDLPPCAQCVPMDCKFGAWTEWFYAGGCTGLYFRHRSKEQENNECGKPCNGTQEVTKQCVGSECKKECLAKDPVNCELGAWGDWADCHGMQKSRTRIVSKQPAYGGKTCSGALTQLQGCGAIQHADCQLSTWGMWTSCSATCGEGWHNRVRRVTQFAEDGGRPCEGSLREMRPCQVETCRGEPCIFGDWSFWAGCDAQSPRQRYRRREIQQEAVGIGKPCRGQVRQTQGCPTAAGQDCVLDDWSDWEACDRTCDGGQTYRKRRISSIARNGGQCGAARLREAKPCNTMSCYQGQADCTLSAWGDWSTCSASCESGIQTRKREVATRAMPGGKGCVSPLEMVQSCQSSTCPNVDCRWDDWSRWSDCSCTCGGGTQRRSRQIAALPLGSGKLCDVISKAEVTACNTQSCGQACVDGMWGEWSTWNDCSSTCGTGFRWRHRDVVQQASSCGKPAVGEAQQWDTCSGAGNGVDPTVAGEHVSSLSSYQKQKWGIASAGSSGDVCGNQDCKVSAWNQWSACSSTCFGVRERQRNIEHFHRGNGKVCNDTALKEVEPCNPGERGAAPAVCTNHVVDCQVGQWSTWSPCPVTCGGGNVERSRHILSPATNGGKPCETSLEETQPCSTQPCAPATCVDCLWGDWSQWGACLKCGDQRFRNRAIKQMANHCGRRCEANDAKEVSDCTTLCDTVQYCTWTRWSDWSECTAKFGTAMMKRQRSLGLVKEQPPDFLFKADVHDTLALCSGTQEDTKQCPTPKKNCTPKPCVFSTWGGWSQPSCTGLCERSRSIQKMNNECGTPCSGSLVNTKRCLKDCTTPRDCGFSDWHDWAQPDAGQEYRTRSVESPPSHGGRPCQGSLRETKGESVFKAPSTSCQVSMWSDWSSCTNHCGGGTKERARHIAAMASHGGTPCDDILGELQPCNTKPCEATDCKLGAWGDWSACSERGQQSRQRFIETPPSARGAPCADTGTDDESAALDETRPCGIEKINCILSAWTSWDDCDKTCGGGERQRHRQVEQYPANGGETCPPNLREIKGCHVGPCFAVDCQVGHWNEWGACSTSCGEGQQSRNRQVSRPSSGLGKPCEAVVSETRSCQDRLGNEQAPCSDIDCKWSEWSDWTGCSCSCGGGNRNRNRYIARAPQDGGAMCQPLSKEEVQPCNTQSCDEVGLEEECVDGKWGDWAMWEKCSASCGGGITWRHRARVTEANDCGKPAVGLSRETASCKYDVPCGNDVDCVFGMWSQWSDCTRTCDGVKRRSRRVKVSGRGHGKHCVGPVKETAPCNPGQGERSPFECSPGIKADCKLDEWTDWSTCPCTCGGCQIRRERSILQEARHGGTGCNGSIAETKLCGKEPCQVVATPVNCVWGLWGDWSACSQCGGQRTRFRHITQEPLNGGKPCEARAAEDMQKCPRECHEPLFCVWGDWGDYSQCSDICGTGAKRSRQRNLVLKSQSELKQLDMKFEENDGGGEAAGGTPGLLAQGLRLEVLAAFVCGYFGRAALLAGSRAWSRHCSASVPDSPGSPGGMYRDSSPGCFGFWPRLTSGASGHGYQRVSLIADRGP